MKHETAVELLHDLLYGEMDGEKRAELQAHMSECEECRGFEDTYRVLRAALPVAAAIDHPRAEDIVAFALADPSLDPATRERLAEHVARCEGCALELERIREVESGAQQPVEHRGPSRAPRSARLRAWLVPAVVAGVLLLLLGYPAYLGLSRGADRGRAQTWSGTVTVESLRSPLRKGDGPRQIQVDPERPVLLFAVELTVPPDLAPDATLIFEFLDAGNERLGVLELPASEVREQIRTTGVVTWLVPAATFEPGQHHLRVVAASEPATLPLLEVPFEILGSDGG